MRYEPLCCFSGLPVQQAQLGVQDILQHSDRDNIRRDLLLVFDNP
jgi:hypothetical protein